MLDTLRALLFIDRPTTQFNQVGTGTRLFLDIDLRMAWSRSFDSRPDGI